ncbi:hypothetical protein LTR62_007287 [Meristemomyces frigidus]|uniref:Uncharacterized protein n=1 Tax=Meristemomyces frigidus TaxID=1508187 RepID=A0AAN7YIT6_9PEZI|nr:hypothetical protein LTR62_007287 [Meristemomyces frigidus]
MSRSMLDEHDPYRSVTMMRSSTDSPRPRQDGESVYSASTQMYDHEKAGLVSNAQRPPHADSRVDSMSPHNSKQLDDLAPRQLHSMNRSMPASRRTSVESPQSPANIPSGPQPRKPSLPRPAPPSEPIVSQYENRHRSTSVPRPPRKSSISAASMPSTGLPAEEAPPMPSVYVQDDAGYDVDPSMIHTGRFSIDTPNPSKQFPVQDQPMSSMGLRPLPPAMPTEDNPEIRANRIRSFYKEYFDDSKPNPANGQYHQQAQDSDYYDAAIYDPETGGFAMPGRPYAQPMGRRAMTPPPRGAQSRGASPAPNPHNRHFSTQSAGRGQMPRGRQGPPPPMPKKRAPPPKALQGLPTPHKLKDFDSVISSPIDFAPPSTFRSMQNGGAPDSPTGIQRPYSPSVRPFTPLATAYDELSVMPSPHLLRKSGTFTGLDFAPPGRLGQHNDNASDAGSIRSARSGISARQLDAVRAGAYRVSRIPKEYVSSKEDWQSQLRPKMDLVSRA